MRLSILGAALLLFCAAAWAADAAAQPWSSYGRKPSRLYQVADERGRPGFIDRSGRLRIGFERLRGVAYVGNFSEGLAAACVANERTGHCADAGFGYIDETGKFVIPPRFRAADIFSEGLAFVSTKQGEGGYINRRGELVLKMGKGAGASPFTDGLAYVSEGRYIDRSGKTVIKLIDGSFGVLSEGLVPFLKGHGREAKYGFADREGKVVIPPRFEPEREHHGFIRYVRGFSGGRAAVKLGDSYGFIDRKGDVVIAPQFAAASYFNEGFASVWRRRGESVCEFIDASGRNAFGRTFKYCGSFTEGLAAVAVETKAGEKWGYIDRRGRFVIEPQFDGADPFAGGLAPVYTSDGERASTEWWAKARRGYIDRSGRYVWRQPAKK